MEAIQIKRNEDILFVNRASCWPRAVIPIIAHPGVRHDKKTARSFIKKIENNEFHLIIRLPKRGHRNLRSLLVHDDEGEPEENKIHIRIVKETERKMLFLETNSNKCKCLVTYNRVRHNLNKLYRTRAINEIA